MSSKVRARGAIDRLSASMAVGENTCGEEQAFSYGAGFVRNFTAPIRAASAIHF
tara:strand:+ start:256 stop:417 length:162 start_codon:yes stop_codon:yes gene_type:complete